MGRVMFAIVAAALALAGAPANTNVSCGPVPMGEQGWTWWDETPPRIVLGQIPCAASLYASASPREQRAIQRLNPAFSPDVVEGAGLLVLLHEAVHAAGSHDETAAECEAMRLLPQLLREANADTASIRNVARAWDANLAPVYHEYACS